jgi:hypothetical protein
MEGSPLALSLLDSIISGTDVYDSVVKNVTCLIIITFQVKFVILIETVHMVLSVYYQIISMLVSLT